jgi:hypothetical protein
LLERVELKNIFYYKEELEMTAQELLEIAYITKNWDIRLTPKQISKLIDDAREYAKNLYVYNGIK